jgi:hypothetical protein
MPSALADFLFGSVLPRVEDPLPKSIGLGFPFALAGAGGVFAGVIYADASPVKRNRAISVGGQIGFWLGMAFYFFSLAVQVASSS